MTQDHLAAVQSGTPRLYLHSAVINVAASVKRDLAYVFLKTQLSYSLSHKLCCSLQSARTALSWSLMCPETSQQSMRCPGKANSFTLPACKAVPQWYFLLPYLVRSKLSIKLVPDVW